MLDRYRKSGGFIQLLNLIETTGPAKQKSFLEIIRKEDSTWAQAIESRILTIDRIFSWPDYAVAEVAGGLQELTIVVAMHGLDEAKRELLTRTFTHAVKRRIQESFEASKPTPAEISAMLNKIITETRKLITENRLRMDKIDPGMMVPDDIEEQLKRGTLRLVPSAAAETVAEESGLNFEMAEHLGSTDGASKEELVALRKKVMALNAENTKLKQEVTQLKTKLDQIKKMVA